MSAATELDYAAPLSYLLEEAELSFDWEEEPERAPLPEPAAVEDGSPSDLGYFMNLAGRFELLTAEEERRLGAILWRERARLLRLLRRSRRSRRRDTAFLEPVLGSRPVTPSTRRRLARVEKLARQRALETKGARRGLVRSLEQAIGEIDEARKRLVEHNLRLVVWVAKSFRGRGFDFIDLIQEGSLGLMRAVDRFDPRVGARFSTFATHWIQQGIRRALAEKARAIRIPVNRIPEVRQTVSAREALSHRLGRAPQVAEIAAETGTPAKKIEELLPAIAPIDSLDAPIPATEKLFGETLEDRSRRSPLEEAMEEETRRVIQAVLQELPNRQRIILSMRHGIDYPHECTLDEIGEALGLSRERIRQVEKVAAASVREWIRKNRPRLAEPV